ncbi:hypothetical protein IJ579_04695 [bacterium]|nr:hypothetical protein [bacterium]
MKKIFSLLLLSTIILISTTTAQAQPPSKDQVRQKFEQRLQLTKKQKEKAKAIHQQGFEQMKPVMIKIELAKTDIDKIKNSDLDQKSKDEQISRKRDEIKVLEKQAREIRRQNSQEFEKILTKKQKKELELMKAEGRANFNKKHPPRPPFGNFGTGFNGQGFFAPQRLFPIFQPPSY